MDESEFDAEAIFVRNVELVQHDMDEESFLHDEEQALVHVINESARFILEQCDGTITLAKLAGMLQSRYPDIEPDVLQRDLKTAVATMYSKSLIRLA